MEQAMMLSGGRAFQGEETAYVKVPRQLCARHSLGAARRPVHLEWIKRVVGNLLREVNGGPCMSEEGFWLLLWMTWKPLGILNRGELRDWFGCAPGSHIPCNEAVQNFINYNLLVPLGFSYYFYWITTLAFFFLNNNRYSFPSFSLGIKYKYLEVILFIFTCLVTSYVISVQGR